jgi:hypothetical protein
MEPQVQNGPLIPRRTVRFSLQWAIQESSGADDRTQRRFLTRFGSTGIPQHPNRGLRRDVVGLPGERAAARCMLALYALEGISTWLQRLDRFAQLVERTKGDR